MGIAASVIKSLTPQALLDWYYETQLLSDIQRLYEERFGGLPVEFKLKDFDFERAKTAKPTNLLGKFVPTANNIVNSIDSYLKKRAKRPFWSNGKKGDPLERFLYEFRRWAMEEFAGFDNSKASYDKVVERIEYLEELLKPNSKYFQVGLYARGLSKVSTFEKIISSLEKYINLRNLQEDRKSVHTALKESSDLAKNFYTSSMNYLYLSTDELAHENTFSHDEFYNFENINTLSVSAKSIFKRLKENIIGAIFRSVLDMSYLDGDNESKKNLPPSESTYYQSPDKVVSKELFHSPNKKIASSFPWSTPANEKEHVEAFQNLGRDILNMSELISALEISVDQTEKEGNVWAKGPGEKELQLMMDDFEASMTALETHCNTFRRDQNRLRRAYYHEQSGNTESINWEENFTRIKTEYNIMRSASEEILKKFKFTKEKLAALRANKLGANKSEDPKLSLALHNRNAKRHGETIALSGVVDAPPAANSPLTSVVVIAAQGQYESKLEILKRKIAALVIPLQTHPDNSFAVIDKPQFAKYNTQTRAHVKPFSQWSENHDYENWIAGFTTRNKDFFKKYNMIIDVINTLLQPESHNTLDDKKATIFAHRKLLNELFDEMLKKIDVEAPRWKVKRYGIIPVPVRLGRPFNSAATKFAKFLKDELLAQFNETKILLKEAVSILKTVKPAEVGVVNLQLAPHLQVANIPDEEKVHEVVPVNIPEVQQNIEEATQFITKVEEPVVPVIHFTKLTPSAVPNAVQQGGKSEEIKAEEMKTDEADDLFDDSLNRLINRCKSWREDKSSPLMIFHDKLTVQKYLKSAIDFKNGSSCYEDFLPVMQGIIDNIELIIQLLPADEMDLYKSSIAQLITLKSLLEVMTISDPELYQTNLDLFRNTYCKPATTNLQDFSLYRQPAPNPLSPFSAEQHLSSKHHSAARM